MINKEYYILITDDNIKNLQLAGKILLEKGYKTDMEKEGELALDI